RHGLEENFMAMTFPLPSEPGDTRIPDACPICHHGIEARQLAAFTQHDRGTDVAYKCPRNACGSMFIARYPFTSALGLLGLGRFSELVPRTSETPVLSENVRKVSPDFVRIYTQAL